MQIIRTIVWITITAALVAFVAMNWEPAPLFIFPHLDGGGRDCCYSVSAPVGLIAVFFFLLGATPMWLLSKAGRWRMNRRLAVLENSVRAVAPTPAHGEAVPTASHVSAGPGD